jgi:hypothetical protein
VAAMFSYGFALNPRMAHFIASVFSVEAISDLLHLGYQALKQRVKE